MSFDNAVKAVSIPEAAILDLLLNEQKDLIRKLDTIVEILKKYARRDGLISNKV